MNSLPFVSIGLPDVAPAAPADVPWPVAGQGELFAKLLQASLTDASRPGKDWPVPESTDSWLLPKSTDADPAFIPDTEVPAPAPIVLSSEAGPAIASFATTALEAWLIDQATDVPQRPVTEEMPPQAEQNSRPAIDEIELESGAATRCIVVRIATDVAATLARSKVPADLEFDFALPRAMPFAIPAELDIPDRPVPVPEALPVPNLKQVPESVRLPETRKTVRIPVVRQPSQNLGPIRNPLTGFRAAALEQPLRELVVVHTDVSTRPMTHYATGSEILASQCEREEVPYLRSGDRGRVRPLHIATASHRPEAAITRTAVRAPEPVASGTAVTQDSVARGQHLESRAHPDVAPAHDSQPGVTAPSSQDPAAAGALEVQAAGRVSRMEPEVPVPVRFVLEDWVAGQPVSHVRMLLEPKDLGGLRISLRHNHNGVHARIVVDRVAALPQVEAGMSALRGLLAARGIQFSSFSLTALTAAGAAGLKPDGMPNGESAGDRQSTRSQGKGKRSGRTARS